ncbi:hypothetical protein KHC33_08775 [Methanospirillum sp. J.3.6.1-F.2.7.3]|uniref:Uncharacterized protein n=3 Tax=Methanospirillum TaxID=2202 RepID=A0A8E7ATX1_9EURY|nr:MULTISPECIES: hypothetical protein [Methanospirillum]NLW76762.1 hypothetical protein [Methanomicrobiales archaeon]QVV87472.1 hypothetical protein KHC33_08775 [Methanospirillum sp. J.3.6.1-F.2.7.3]QXO94936.1 hypothetical protein KSK55_00505 [Methanospirillum hungatei]
MMFPLVQYRSAPRIFLVFMIFLISLLVCGGGCAVFAEKISTTLTIGTDPVDPGESLPFTVSGILTDGDGNVMGNKKVTLEQLKSDDPNSEYEFLAVATTDIDGVYTFKRPEAAPAEFLRVKFNGNSQFEGSVSDIVSGHITKEPQVKTGVVPAVAKSNTLITAKASPSNPSPGQTVSITGQLMGENGTPLEGKKVICESSDRVGTRSDFSILGISTTDKNGFFKFTVGGGSTTTYIQVHFAGDDSYEESFSNLIVVL